MILHKQPTKPWDKYDFLLLEAYQILEEERCSQCGYPRYICHNESNVIQFHMDEDTCAAVVAKDRYEDQQRRADEKYKPPAGTVLRPVAYMTDGGELTSMREPYYIAEAATRKALSESLLDVG